MASTYSENLRERVVRAVEAGVSKRSTAQKFEVSVSFVIWMEVGLYPSALSGMLPAFFNISVLACG